MFYPPRWERFRSDASRLPLQRPRRLPLRPSTISASTSPRGHFNQGETGNILRETWQSTQIEIAQNEITLAFFSFSAIMALVEFCVLRARRTLCRVLYFRACCPGYSTKSFRINGSKTPRFAVFYWFFLQHKFFRMNTYKKSAQVFILKDLRNALSPLESALTKKGGGGCSEAPECI